MDKDVLSAEEKKIMQDFEAGKLKRVPDAQKRKVIYQKHAQYTLNTHKRFNAIEPQGGAGSIKIIKP